MPVFKVGKKVKGYKIVRLLGDQAGAEGIPFEAETADGRRVFLKQFLRHKPRSPEGKVFFKIQKELKTRLAGIPRFVSTIEDVFEHENSFVQVAEWVEGTNPSEMSEKLPFEQRYLHGTLLAFAINSVHQEGIAHLDLKPDNVIIERRSVDNDTGETEIIEVARVIDFDAAVIEGIPRTSDCLGTVLYMSPEHVRSKALGLPSLPADVFSLGIMLYELLTEYYPYEIDDLQEDGYFSRKKFIQAVKAHRVKPLNHMNRAIPAEVSVVIDTCLALHPKDRPTAKQVHNCLINHRPTEGTTEELAVPDPTPIPAPEAIREQSLILKWKYSQITVNEMVQKLIGRSDFESYLPVSEKRFASRISRRHARCYKENDKWKISRLSQYNPLRINEKQVEYLRVTEIQDGDKIRLGPIRMTARVGY